VLVGVGGFFLVNAISHNPATDVVNQYYTAVEQQDYATAFSNLGTSSLTIGGQACNVGACQSLYTQAALAFDAQKGKVTSYSITSTSINSNNGVSTAAFTVSVTRNGAPYDVHLKLQQEGSTWKIVNIDSF